MCGWMRKKSTDKGGTHPLRGSVSLDGFGQKNQQRPSENPIWIFRRPCYCEPNVCVPLRQAIGNIGINLYMPIIPSAPYFGAAAFNTGVDFAIKLVAATAAVSSTGGQKKSEGGGEDGFHQFFLIKMRRRRVETRGNDGCDANQSNAGSPHSSHRIKAV